MHVASNMEPSDPIIKLKATKHDGKTETVNIHRGVLCKSSGFFQKAMRPEWTKSREQADIIDLLDDSVDTVSDYIKWLYSDKMPIKLYNAAADTHEKKGKEAAKVFPRLVEAYVFGEKIIDAKYKNTIMRTVLAAIDVSHCYPGLGAVHIIYKGTPSTSPFRRLLADSVAYVAHDDSERGNAWMKGFDEYPREALVDAIKATVKVRSTSGGNMPLQINSYLEEEDQEK